MVTTLVVFRVRIKARNRRYDVKCNYIYRGVQNG